MNNTATVPAQDVKEELEGLIIEFFSNLRNSISISKYLNKDEESVTEILVKAQRDWDDAECDDEGATPEQDREMDNIIKDTIDQLLSI